MLASAPTDNLYKFLTFLGIALFVFCLWQQLDREQQIERGIWDGRAQEHLLYARMLEMQKETTRLNALPQDELEKQRTEVEKSLDHLRAQLAQSMPELEKWYTENGRATLTQYQYFEDTRIWLLGGQIAGALMALGGILAWYWLHQRHQDALLRVQLSAAIK